MCYKILVQVKAEVLIVEIFAHLMLLSFFGVKILVFSMNERETPTQTNKEACNQRGKKQSFQRMTANN